MLDVLDGKEGEMATKLDARVPVGTAAELGLAGYADHIETAFKVAPPVRLVDDGFGCLGVMMRDPVTDTVQCHVCGKWRKQLGGFHLRTHGLTAGAYRKKYGLLRGFPLCGRSVSARRSVISKKHVKFNNFKRIGEMARKQEKGSKRGRNSLAWYNTKGLCPEQAVRRYEMVIEASGKAVPSEADLARYDPELRGHLVSQCRYHFGGYLNKWRASNGFEQNKTPKKLSDGFILAALRKMAANTGRIPRPNDFLPGSNSTMSDDTVYRRFGSWNRALRMAGFEPAGFGRSGGETSGLLSFRREG